MPVKARRFSPQPTFVRFVITALTMSQILPKALKMSPAVEVAQQLRGWIADDVRARSDRGIVNAIYEVARSYGLTARRVRAIYHNEVKAPLAWEYLQVQRRRDQAKAERLATMNAEAAVIRESLKDLEGRCSNVSGQKLPWF